MAWDTEIVDGVVVVTFSTNRVGAQNRAFLADMHETIDYLEDEQPHRSVVLTGSGSIFSVGLDLKEVMPLFAGRDPVEIGAFFDAYRAANLRLFTLARPTVAAVNGHAIAGGIITALLCDTRIGVTGDHQFGLNEVTIGLPLPAVYAEVVRHALGNPAAARAVLGGMLFGPAEAVRLGFFHETVDPPGLLAAAVDWAQRIPAEAFPAYAYAKRALQAGALERIEGDAARMDRDLAAVISDPGLERLRAERFEEITGISLADFSPG